MPNPKEPDFSSPEKLGDFFKEKVIENVRNQLHGKLKVMFEKPKPQLVQREGDNLYIMDQIYDVWPEDEQRGKSAKLIQDIVLGKIKDYERIHDEFDYAASEYDYRDFGTMLLIFHYVKKKNY